MIRLVKYLKPYTLSLLFALALLYAQAMCDLALPDYMADLINKGAMNNDFNFIARTGGIMLLIALAGTACSVLVGYISSKDAAGIALTLRKNVFTRVESYANAEFDEFSTSSLITRTTNDVTQIQTFIVMGIRLLCYAPIMGVGGIIKAIDKSPDMSWTIVLAVVVIVASIGLVLTIAMPKFQSTQKQIDKLNLIFRENLSGMLVIRAFNTQTFEEGRFDKANKELTDTNLFINRVMTTMMPLMMVVMNLTTVLITWVGSVMVSAFKIDIGDMMAYMQYAMQVLMAFLMMAMMLILIPRASVSGARIADVLEKEPSVKDPVDPVPASGLTGIVEYRDVCFSYPKADENVLHNISFIAEPGKTTAFIGSTGAGKTTLVSLLPRFYDVTDGQILIDGIDVRSMTQHDLRDNIGYVSQKGVLFAGTIESNIKYADENATEDEVKRIAEIAQASPFIEAMPEKYASTIAQGGTNVSGGQKQRLSIARALMKKSKIYVFDDSFSALDFKTDAALRKALVPHTIESTILLVAQRISTIMYADQIIVLEHGRIAGKGTHKELMQTCDVYKEIAYSQLSKEELA